MNTSSQGWHRQPIAWLAIVIFVVTLAGCIHLVFFAMAHEDPPLVVADKEVSFRIPATRQPEKTPETTQSDTP